MEFCELESKYFNEPAVQAKTIPQAAGLCIPLTFLRWAFNTWYGMLFLWIFLEIRLNVEVFLKCIVTWSNVWYESFTDQTLGIMSNVPLSAGLQATSKRVCFDQNLSANLYSLLPVLFSKSRPKLFNRRVQYYIVNRNFRWSILMQRINFPILLQVIM